MICLCFVGVFGRKYWLACVCVRLRVCVHACDRVSLCVCVCKAYVEYVSHSVRAFSQYCFCQTASLTRTTIRTDGRTVLLGR